jgi:hypothetical protein
MIRGNRGHAVIGVPHPPATIKSQPVSDRLPDVVVVGRDEAGDVVRGSVSGIRHGPTAGRQMREQVKNAAHSSKKEFANPESGTPSDTAFLHIFSGQLLLRSKPELHVASLGTTELVSDTFTRATACSISPGVGIWPRDGRTRPAPASTAF